MAKTEHKHLAGWGNYPRVHCTVARPLRCGDVAAVLDGNGTIARGLGRSYGDQAISAAGTVVDCTGLDRYREFDADTGLLTCEAGVSLADIIATFAPRGWFPMVTPGTKFVTVGGCIANDVHGKGHHVDGCFSSCVESFSILLADGKVVTASRKKHADLFWGCLGGLGLLGIILTATIHLRRIETTYFNQRAIRVPDLDALLAALDENDQRYPYSVAWIDALAKGRSLGRGVLTVGDHASVDQLPVNLQREPLRIASQPTLSVPFHMPEIALNGLTIRMLNRVIEQVQARGAPLAHYEKFFYPLDAIGNWNRGYGRRGFTQYQFVIPLADGARCIRAILERVAASGFSPFLNVLKKFGEGKGILSFPFAGYTFAIDFPMSPRLRDFTRTLDQMVVDAGGRIYLGKDALLAGDMFRAMYPQHTEWLAIKEKYDPDNLFTSDLARRIGLVLP